MTAFVDTPASLNDNTSAASGALDRRPVPHGATPTPVRSLKRRRTSPAPVTPLAIAAPARSVRTLRIGLLGYGQIGQAVAAAIQRHEAEFLQAGWKPRIVAALVRDERKPRATPLPPGTLLTDATDFLAYRFDVVIEALGGASPAVELLRSLLRGGVSVVTANKSVIAAHGVELAGLAAQHGATLHVEAAAIAGVPFLTALKRRPLGAALTGVTGILNGTSNFVLTRLAQGAASLAESVQAAQRRGLAEPDPAADLSGRDAAEKLAIILQHGGVVLAPTAIERQGIDALTPEDAELAHGLGGVLKPVAAARITRPSTQTARGGSARVQAFVGPAFVTAGHPLARVSGVQNAVTLHSAHTAPVHVAGAGAGPEVTAATILDDVFEALAERAAHSADAGRARTARGLAAIAPAAVRGRSDAVAHEIAGYLAGDTHAPVAPLLTGWFVRVRVRQADIPRPSIYATFEAHGLTPRQFVGGRGRGRSDSVAVLLAAQPRERLEPLLDELVRAGHDVLALRVLPEDL